MRRQTIVKNCYALQEQVARDRFTTTWRATALYSPNTFSLTFLTFRYDAVPQATFDTFTRVFMALYRSQSPYLLTPFEYDEWDGSKYLATHWIQGETLGAALKSGRAIDSNQMIDLTIGLLRGLLALEQINVRHNALDADSIIMSFAHARSDVVRVKNNGVSVFTDALQPKRSAAHAQAQAHERDLQAAGVIIHRLVAASKHNNEETERLAKLKQICGEFQASPGAFDSIAAALDRVLSVYPEKRTVDLIKEHATDLQLRDNARIDLYHNRSIQKRYGTSGWIRYRTGRGKHQHRQRHDYQRAAPNGDAAAAAALEDDEPTEPLTIEELEDHGRGGFFVHALSAIRRLFTRKPSGTQRDVRNATPTRDDAQAVRLDPSRANEQETPTAAGSRDSDVAGEPGTRSRWTQRQSRPVADNGRILELFHRLKEHFSGVATQDTPQLRYDARPRRARRPARWRSVLRDALRNRATFTYEQRAQAAAERYEARRAQPQQRPRPAAAAGGQALAAWKVDRAAASQAQDHDFQPGPEYAPGERRALEDEAGPHRDVSFGASSVRTDRDETERRVAADKPHNHGAEPSDRAGGREEMVQPATATSEGTLGTVDAPAAQEGSSRGMVSDVSPQSSTEHRGRPKKPSRRPTSTDTDESEPAATGSVDLRRQRSRTRRQVGRRSWLSRLISSVRTVGRRVRRTLIGPWS